MQYVHIKRSDEYEDAWYPLEACKVVAAEGDETADSDGAHQLSADSILYYRDESVRRQTPLRFGDADYLTITSRDDNGNVTLLAEGEPEVSGLQYRTHDSLPWQKYTIGTQITLGSAGDYVQFRNNASTLSLSTADYVRFSTIGHCDASGEIQSMLAYTPKTPAYSFYHLFAECLLLITPPKFPFLPLGASCYQGMFLDCRYLETAPVLPATRLARECYAGMFRRCWSLTVPPELPAIHLNDGCYNSMFADCRDLTKIPVLPADVVMPYSYSSMFSGCKSIKEAEIAATRMSYGAMSSMFMNCESLERLTVHFTDWKDIDNIEATGMWVYMVSETGVFRKPEALPEKYGYSDYIPKGWTVENF